MSSVRILRPVPSLPSSKARQRNPIKAQVAQLVEQLAFNQLVLGSNPSLRTFFLKNPPTTAGFLCPNITRSPTLQLSWLG